LEYTTLNTGARMPMLGFGVFQVTDLMQCKQIVLDAIDIGYRLFDTAAVYGNEAAVGEAIAEAIAMGKVKREDLFITSKLWVQDMNAYDVDIDNIMQKSDLTFANDIERERTKKHLEKGNITQVTFQQENRQIQGFAVLNPQWKMLNLYDSAMNRVTIQNQLVKPEVTQAQQKNNVPEHSISR